MSSAPKMIDIPGTPNFAPKLYGIGLLVAGIIITGVWLVSRYNDMDLARDLQTWQEKLNLIAESRTDVMNDWVSGNFKELRTLADNPSLQLYMTELESMKSEPAPKAKPDAGMEEAGEASQKSYLRNLLLFTAQRAGFAEKSGDVAAIPANVKTDSKNGLAIIGNNNEVLVSTQMQNSTRDIMLEHVRESAAGQEGLIDIRKDKEGTPYIGFIVPIYSIQGDKSPASQMGRVVGIKTLDANFYNLLKHPGVTEKTLETILVRNYGDKIQYISPLEDDTDALEKFIVSDPNKSAESKLVQATGSFVSGLKDYRDKTVLATSRSVPGTTWTLIVKIDRSEALAASDERRAGMGIFFFLIIAIIVLIVSSTWWRAHSKRSMMMSTYFQKLAAYAQAQEHLLRIVADNQPEPIYIVDARQTLYFANLPATNSMGMSEGSLAGKSLRDVRGAARALQISTQCNKVMETHDIGYDVQRAIENGEEKVIRSAYIPLDHIPVVGLPENTPGVLIVEQDISAVVHERERRMDMQRQLIQTLVMLVDKRDPFAANHSQLVAQVAYEVAVEMDLENVMAETTSIAGNLMNIGKIIVPKALLTKTGALTSEEKRIIHDSMTAAADMLASVSFDGPVADTLRQWQEKWDGTGPLKLRGEDILISARIIAVANAFIGMISPRSWRTAMSLEAASKFLLDQAETAFDRRVVIALINFVENRKGKDWLAKVLSSQKSA